MRHYFYYILLLVAVVGMSSCNSGKYFFNQRIHHHSQPDAQGRKEVDSYIEKPTRNHNLVFYPEAKDTLRMVEKNEPIVTANTKHREQRQVLKKIIPVPGKFSVIQQQRKIPDRPSFPAKKPVTGHDKEGFILLIILAALLIGLGLLLYFLLDALGLIFLILFSVAAGVLIILVLIALVI